MESLQFDNEEMRHETEVLRNQVSRAESSVVQGKRCVGSYCLDRLVHPMWCLIEAHDLQGFCPRFRHRAGISSQLFFKCSTTLCVR